MRGGGKGGEPSSKKQLLLSLSFLFMASFPCHSAAASFSLPDSSECANCYKEFCYSLNLVELVNAPFVSTSYGNNAYCTKDIFTQLVSQIQLTVDATGLADSGDFVRVALCSFGYWVTEGLLSSFKMDCHDVDDDISNKFVYAGQTKTFTLSNFDDSSRRIRLWLMSNAAGSTESPTSQYKGIKVSVANLRCISGYGLTAVGGNRYNCQICPAGYFRSQVSSESCTLCPDGKVQPVVGQSSCDQCPAGKYASMRTECLLCEAGKYQYLNSCSPCDVGYYGVKVGATSIAEACVACSPGTYSIFQSSTSCRQCDAGKYQDEGRRTGCKDCPEGTASAALGASSSSTCVPCAGGQFSIAGGTKCFECGVGTYIGSASGSACKRCMPGNYSGVPGSTACSMCEPGKYSSGEESSSCTSCSAGTFSSVYSATGCTICPAGKYSWEDSTTCYSCQAGKYSNVSGAPSIESCLRCPPGTFSSVSASTNCTRCPWGTQTSVAASTTCTTCGMGMRALSPSATGCERCSPGTYYDMAGQPNTECISCPAGTASSAVGATSSSTCIACKPGSLFSSAPASSTCQDCSALSPDAPIKDAGHDACLVDAPCPPGYVPRYAFPQFVQSGLDFACDRCPKGTFEQVNGTCTTCPSAKYQPNFAQTFCTSCAYALQESAMPRDSASTCYCPAGMFQDAAASPPSCTPCRACVAGSYWATPCTTQTNRASSLLCTTTCGDGKYISSPCQCEGNIECSDCHPCPAGTYLALEGMCNGVEDNQCTPCSPGTYSSAESWTQSSCAPCPAGSYAASSGMQQCLQCPAGKRSASSSGSSTCTLCEPGTFFAPATLGTSQCSLCPAGSFSSGAGGASQCTSCPAGTTQPAQGKSSCNACAPGTFYGGMGNADATCLLCAPGTYAASNGSAICLACPAGKHQPLAGSSSCNDCIPGTASTADGLATSTCPACPAGTYSSSPGSSVCTSCPPGSFSNASVGTNVFQCIPCSPGYYAGAEGMRNCSACPAGKYSQGGAALCTPCPVGSISTVAASQSCRRCPDGTSYSNVSGSTYCNPCSRTCIGGVEEQIRPCNSTWDRMCVKCRTKECTRVARHFRDPLTTVTYAESVVVDILLVGGGAAGSPEGGAGGDAGTLLLYLNYTILAGTYDVVVGAGGLAPAGNGGDTSFGNMFVVRGGNYDKKKLATNNVVNGVPGIGPTLNSRYVLIDNAGGGAGENGMDGLRQINVPGRDYPFDLCAEFGLCDVEMGRGGLPNAGDAYALANTGSGGDGGFYGGDGGSGIVVVRVLDTVNVTCGAEADACYDKCLLYSFNTRILESSLFDLETDILVDLLLVGGGGPGNIWTGGGSGAVLFVKNHLLKKGRYMFQVGAAYQESGIQPVDGTFFGKVFARAGDSYGNSGGYLQDMNVVDDVSVSIGIAHNYAAMGNAGGGSNGSPTCIGNVCTASGGGGASSAGINAAVAAAAGNWSVGGAGTSKAVLAGGEVYDLCTYFNGFSSNCMFARGGGAAAADPSIPGSGGSFTSPPNNLSPGTPGAFAIRTSATEQDLSFVCRAICKRRCTCSQSLSSMCSFCAPGTYLHKNTSKCVACPRNTYRDMTVQDAAQCTPCLQGFVTKAEGSKSSTACKSWCSSARKEKGLVTVDTFPKPSWASNATLPLPLVQVPPS